MKKADWNRLLWGVELIDEHKETMIIGGGWHENMIARYEGEPSRPILFLTRKLSREWCKGRNKQYESWEWPCNKWRFRPIRVREIVKPQPVSRIRKEVARVCTPDSNVGLAGANLKTSSATMRGVINLRVTAIERGKPSVCDEEGDDA